jgi:chemosensory pili system protein ChpC
MNKKQVAKTVPVPQIPCLLLPLHGRTLLVPTVTVAEMVPMAPCQREEGLPDWSLGTFEWRGRQVPLVSFEHLSGDPVTELAPKGRFAVLNNTGLSDDLPFIAVPTRAIPRMARIAPDDIKENPGSLKKPCELMRVKVGMEELAIPDVSALEKAYLEYRTK